ncbi:MAG: alpha/beta fold hydrolase [Candidatus Thorarchaeota archaeon]|jgi:pimeloyl-ACP methyl ester carboxylesterase
MPFFEHKGLKLHYVDVDKRADKTSGIPLLFIHGAGSSHLAWTLQLRDLSDEFRLIAIDLSGHGKSEEMEGDLSIEEHYAEEVSSLVRHLGLNDFVIVAHSMGGGVAMAYTLKETVVKPRGLVLADTSSDLDLTKLGVGLAKDTIEDRVRLFKKEYFDDITDVKKAEGRLLSANPQVMIRDLAACNSFDITDQLGLIDIPTFVIVGENDDVISPAIAKNLETALPRAHIAVVKDADHTPMQEQPVMFNILLRKFVFWIINNM